MKKLYYIEQESFLRDLVETLGKQSDEFECFTTDNGREQLYFFNDLTPDFILIDWATISSYQSELLAELQQVAQIPVGVTIGPDTKLSEEWSSKVSLILEKPLVAKSLLKKIFP